MKLLNAQHLERAVRVLRAGGVIAYPTEGVWGLGCDPLDQAAVARILVLKGRDPDQGLILVAASIEQVEPYLQRLPLAARHELQRSWPGGTTWVVPVVGEVPGWIVGRHSSVALRVTDHPQVIALCERFGSAIVSTSANPHGRPAARSLLKVRQYFRDRVDYVLPGELGGRRQPSQIRDALTGRMLRPG